MDEAVEAALADVMARLEKGGEVTRDWLRRRYPDCCDVLEEALRVDLSIAAHAPPPARLGRYRVLRELGRGGMGTVYLAEADRPGPGVAAGTRVALKLIHPHLTDATLHRRLVRECEIGRRLRHENVVRTFGLEIVERAGVRLFCLAMEYVEGQTLRTLLQSSGHLPEETCRRAGREIAAALAAIHAAGAVHRDLKPENLILARNAEGYPVVKVMDLGVAWLASAGPRLSTAGSFVGSLLYAAPEQFGQGGAGPAGPDIDGRADLYALGLVLYELATGRHPFADGDLRVLVRRQLESAPQPATALNPELSPFFDEVTRTLIAKDPRERFSSAEELREVLEQGERSAWWSRRTAQSLRRAPRGFTPVPRETALHGRAAELAALRSRFESARRGDGQAVLVQAQAGLGKSRLLEEFADGVRAAHPDAVVLWGACRAGTASESGFAAACRDHFGADGLGDALRRLLAATPALVAGFSALLREEPPPPGSEALTAESFDSVAVQVLRGLATEATVVLALDDLHNATEAQRVFRALAHAVSGRRILLVGAARPELETAWTSEFERLGHASRLELRPLEDNALSALLTEALGSESLAKELAPIVRARSDGNPWFALQMIRDLRERGRLRQRSGGAWERAGVIDTSHVPATVAELVLSRVRDLADDDRELLDAAACCGREFDATLVADALSRPRVPALRRFAEMGTSRGLVRATGRSFAFDHHLLQETLYAAIPEALREEYHGLLGAALERRGGSAPAREAAVTLCDHFLRARHAGRARPHLDPALAHLGRIGRLAEQSALAERALALPGFLAGTERCHVLLLRCEALSALGRRDDERAAIDEALPLAEECDRPAMRAQARAALGRHFVRTGRTADAAPVLEEALRIAQEAGDRVAEGRVRAWLGLLACDVGRHEEARVHHERVLALAEASGDRIIAAMACGNLAIVHFRRGAYDAARELWDSQLARSRSIGHRWSESGALSNLGMLLMKTGRMAAARENLGRTLELKCELGLGRGRAITLHNLSLIHTFLGDLARARETADAARSAFEGMGEAGSAARSLQNLGTVHAAAGDAARAEATYRAALTVHRAEHDQIAASMTLYLLGGLLEAAERIDEARVALEESVALGSSMDFPFVMLPPRLALAALRGDARSARTEMEALGGALGPVEAMEARFLLWRATRGPADLARARALLEEFLEHAPPECREGMIARVPLHHAIAGARP